MLILNIFYFFCYFSSYKINKYDLELFGEEKNDGSISYGALEKANKGTLFSRSSF